MTDAKYGDDQALLANKPAKLTPYCTTWSIIYLYVNTNKIEFMYFKQEEVISILSGKTLTLANKFTYLGSNI